jgi:hypothetical protein
MADPNFAVPGVIYVHRPRVRFSDLRANTLLQHPQLLRLAIEEQIADVAAPPPGLGSGPPFFPPPRLPPRPPAPAVEVLGGLSAAFAGSIPPPVTPGAQQFVDAVAAALPPDP